MVAFCTAGAADIDGSGADKRGAGPRIFVPSTDVIDGNCAVMVGTGSEIEPRGVVKRLTLDPDMADVIDGRLAGNDVTATVVLFAH